MDNQEIQKIINMIYHYGRPLEEARIKYLLFDGTADDVIHELSKFQNEDGGFAHSLEPDLWNPNSTPLQSWTAITILRELNFNPENPVILKLIDYLEESFDETQELWPLLYKSNDLYPHAPWWNYVEKSDNFNPSASIAGFLIKYANPLSKAFKYANKVFRKAVLYLNSTTKVIEMHELRCLIDLVDDAKDLYKNYEEFKKAKKSLLLHMDNAIEKDSSKWFNSYAVKPSTLIKSHPYFGSDSFYELMILEFDTALKNRNEQGIWNPTWSWDNDYPLEEKESKNIWMGLIAFEYLYLMIKFGYVIIDKKSANS
jgi:hypothetical protein